MSKAPSYKYPHPTPFEDIRRLLTDERGELARRFYESIVKVIEMMVLAVALSLAGRVAHSTVMIVLGYFVRGITSLYIWSFFEGLFQRSLRRWTVPIPRVKFVLSIPGAAIILIILFLNVEIGTTVDQLITSHISISSE